MLDIREVTKRYKGATANALDSVSFAVPDNSITALLGPNGAGKSTLVGILSGTIQQDGGQVQIDGIPLSFKDRRILSRIGVVPQEIAFDFVFTTEEILSLEFGYFGLRKDPEWLAFLLERLSLKDKRNVPIRELSGGMKRRLMIAKALIHRPTLLLLDEPTAGVDPRLRDDLRSFLRELSDGGTSVILTTHQLEDAELLCDRIVVLDRGLVVANESRKGFLALAGDYVTAEITTRNREAVASAFSGDGDYELHRTDAGVRVVFEREASARFLKLMADAASLIDTFEIHPPRLEEVFRKITGTMEGDHAARS